MELAAYVMSFTRADPFASVEVRLDIAQRMCDELEQFLKSPGPVPAYAQVSSQCNRFFLFVIPFPNVENGLCDRLRRYLNSQSPSCAIARLPSW